MNITLINGILICILRFSFHIRHTKRVNTIFFFFCRTKLERKSGRCAFRDALSSYHLSVPAVECCLLLLPLTDWDYSGSQLLHLYTIYLTFGIVWKLFGVWFCALQLPSYYTNKIKSTNINHFSVSLFFFLFSISSCVGRFESFDVIVGRAFILCVHCVHNVRRTIDECNVVSSRWFFLPNQHSKISFAGKKEKLFRKLWPHNQRNLLYQIECYCYSSIKTKFKRCE